MYRKNSAFTLVEILIVVIILAVLAAIVVPQFTQASTSSKLSSLQSDLQTMRNQISLYVEQHGEVSPGATIATVLTARTDSTGATGTDSNLFPYGPYMMSVPANPYLTGPAANTINIGTSTVPGDGSSGWYWNRARADVDRIGRRTRQVRIRRDRHHV